MAGHKEAKIYCLYTGSLVRRLTVIGDNVQIDAMVPPIVSVSLDTPITYEPWVMDRGNMLFPPVTEELRILGGGKGLKICGEGDQIRYEDNSVDMIYPKENQ
jgi:hypothetical protein